MKTNNELVYLVDEAFPPDAQNKRVRRLLFSIIDRLPAPAPIVLGKEACESLRGVKPTVGEIKCTPAPAESAREKIQLGVLEAMANRKPVAPPCAPAPVPTDSWRARGFGGQMSGVTAHRVGVPPAPAPAVEKAGLVNLGWCVRNKFGLVPAMPPDHYATRVKNKLHRLAYDPDTGRIIDITDKEQADENI